jgi:hypothetical protein
METFAPTVTFTNWKETGVLKLLGLNEECTAIDENRLPALIPEGKNAHYQNYRHWNQARISVLAMGGIAVLYIWSKLFSHHHLSQFTEGMGFFGAPAAIFVAQEICDAKGKQELKLYATELRDVYRNEVGVMTDALDEMGEDAFKPAIQRVHGALNELFGDADTAKTLALALIEVPIPHTQPKRGVFRTKTEAVALLTKAD